MSAFAIHIGKLIPWRGSLQPIGNTYHLHTNTIESFDDNKAIDELVAAERALFSSSVQFTTARSWGPTDGGQAASKMREVRQLSGTGAGAAIGTFYPEFALLIQWPLGRYGVRNHPQYLRKWLHLGRSMGLPIDGSRSAAAQPVEITDYVTKVTNVNPLGADGPYELCTPDDQHQPTGPGILYPYLEHRQIGR